MKSRSPLFVLMASFLALILSENSVFAAPSTLPPKIVHLPFENAEADLLSRFRQDIGNIERISNKLTVYQVSTTGKLPAEYSSSLRQKIEDIIVSSRLIELIACNGCETSRLIKDSEGNLRYETFSEEPGRPQKIANELGVDHFLYAELNYSPSEVKLRMRLVRASNQELRWTNEYSSTNVIKERERLVGQEYGYEQIHGANSMSHILIGEIAFSMVFSPGIAMLPAIDTMYSSGRAFYPSVDLLIGEKFDNGHKRFGFLIGAIVKSGEDSKYQKLLPWALRIAPQFRYTFNPYNTSTARFSVLSEVGGFVSSSVATAYLSAGPEWMMVKRFSVALMPMFILPTNVKGSQVVVEDENGSYSTSTSPDQGRFGGFGILFKGSMNW